MVDKTLFSSKISESSDQTHLGVEFCPLEVDLDSAPSLNTRTVGEEGEIGEFITILVATLIVSSRN